MFNPGVSRQGTGPEVSESQSRQASESHLSSAQASSASGRSRVGSIRAAASALMSLLDCRRSNAVVQGVQPASSSSDPSTISSISTTSYSAANSSPAASVNTSTESAIGSGKQASVAQPESSARPGELVHKAPTMPLAFAATAAKTHALALYQHAFRQNNAILSADSATGGMKRSATVSRLDPLKYMLDAMPNLTPASSDSDISNPDPEYGQFVAIDRRIRY